MMLKKQEQGQIIVTKQGCGQITCFGNYLLGLDKSLKCVRRVPCKRRSSVNSGAWLRRFDDVTGVAKTNIMC